MLEPLDVKEWIYLRRELSLASVADSLPGQPGHLSSSATDWHIDLICVILDSVRSIDRSDRPQYLTGGSRYLDT
ncbi:hypothetical protein A2U01_0051664, partial [Trifolium medium]|nr:hypothetical protein [Trifolium medium]